MDFQDQLFIVSGAGGSLGAAVLRVCAGYGARIVALDRDVRDDAVDGPRIERIALDLQNKDDVAAVMRQVHARHGRVDALINAVGGFAMGPAVHETPAEDWEHMLDLNVRPLLNLFHAVIPLMQAAGRGRVVNVGALGALQGHAGMGAYVSAKCMVARLTESMAEELREQGINVNAVLPSIIDTAANRAAMPQAEFSHWVAPADLAAVIAFLCSDAARAVHGACIPVRGLS